MIMIFHLTFRRTLILFLCIFILQSILLCFFFLDINVENIQALFPPLNTDSNRHHDHQHHCRIDDSQAISALKRVRSVHCRQRIIDVYCSVKQNLPWPERIQTRCQHFDPSIHGKLIQCSGFDPKRLERAKKRKVTTLFNQTNDHVMDHNNCVEWCLQTDNELALYHRKHCICTNHVDEPPNNGSTADLHYYCDMNCALNLDHCPDHIFTYLTGSKKIPYYLPTLDIINQHDGHQGLVRPKIVFLLLLNGRSVQHILRLLKNIHLLHHYYYIHVDSNDNYLFHELKYLEKKFPNIKLAKKRFNTIWGGSSLLTCILDSIKTILHQWNDWDFVLNLSGTDFPIKKIRDLELYLGRNYGKNFIKSHGKNTEDFIRTQALNKLFVQCDRHLWRIGDRKLIKGIVWDGGSDWVILNRNFSTYLIHSKDSLLSGMINYFHYALLPAESFFHVILRNSEFCSTIINNNLHATNWNRKKGCDCQQKHTVVDWCGCSPNVFRMVDLPRLMRTQTKPLFFARKFEPIIDSDVIDFIEMRFLSNNFALDNSVLYLENIYHRQYDEGSMEKFRQNFYRSIIEQSLTTTQNFGCLNHHYKFGGGGKNMKLLEAYLVFENGNHFKETLLKISISQAIQAELLIRRKVSNHHPTNLLQTNPMISPRLKSLMVCNMFDEKEEIFRNFECLLGQNEPIQVVHEWQTFFGEYRIVFLFFDSINHLIHHESIILNNTKIEDQPRLFYRFPAEKSSSKRRGLWRLLVVQQEQNKDDPILLGVHRFMILPEDGDIDDDPPKGNHDNNYEKADVRYMKLVENEQNLFPNENVSIGLFWSIEQYCIRLKNNYHNHFNDDDNNVTQCDHFLPNENCDQVDWSVEHWEKIIRIL